MKVTVYIFVLLFILNSAVPSVLYSQCCSGEESTLTFTLTGDSAEEDDCKSDCSPVMQCGDCLTWFITSEVFMPLRNSDLKTFYTSFTSGTVIRILQEIFQPPKV